MIISLFLAFIGSHGSRQTQCNKISTNTKQQDIKRDLECSLATQQIPLYRVRAGYTLSASQTGWEIVSRLCMIMMRDFGKCFCIIIACVVVCTNVCNFSNVNFSMATW